MEAKGSQTASVFEQLRTHVPITYPRYYDAVLNGFPLSTLSRIADRVQHGSTMERHLYCDIFNVNTFTYNKDGSATPESVRALNCVALVSDLSDFVTWGGWDGVRSTLTDALNAIPLEATEFEDFDVHRLRSAVLVNIVKEGSCHSSKYNQFVDYFAEHHDVIHKNLETLTAAHQGPRELSLDMVETLMDGASPVLVEGTL